MTDPWDEEARRLLADWYGSHGTALVEPIAAALRRAEDAGLERAVEAAAAVPDKTSGVYGTQLCTAHQIVKAIRSLKSTAE